MRAFVFTYHDWDDDKGAGWDSFRGVFEVESLDELRTKIEEGNNGLDGWHDGDYHVVNADTLEIVERGKIDYGWASDGNTVINSVAAPILVCVKCGAHNAHNDHKCFRCEHDLT